MRAPSLAAFTGLASLAAAGHLGAQATEPLVTDRPDQTESAAVIPSGLVQVEFGTTLTHDDEDGMRVREVAAPATLVRLGVGRRLEARAGFAGWVRSETGTAPGSNTESGLGDLALGFKYRVRDGEGLRPSIALLTTVTLPTAQQGLGNEKLQPTLLLAVAHQLTDRVGIGYNVGTAWTTVSGAMGDVTLLDLPYTVSFGLGVTERIGAFVESFGSVGLSGDGPGRHSADAGVTMLVGANVQLDVSGGVALDADAADWFLGAGASIRLPR